MRIGITDCYNEDKFSMYVDWIRSANAAVELVQLSYAMSDSPDLANIDGIVLTGGGDVNPSFYGKSELLPLAKGIDDRRDAFENKLIQQSLEADIPILGVCRGMQMVNATLGGTLHPDLVSLGYEDHAGGQGVEKIHPITVSPNSLLSDLAGTFNVEVNSYHHQAVDTLGRGLIVVATSSDGVIESAEWGVKEGMPFLMLVQWHPERSSRNNLVSKNLARLFMREVSLVHANRIPQQ
jgi:putative glutamine amidotransferase